MTTTSIPQSEGHLATAREQREREREEAETRAVERETALRQAEEARRRPVTIGGMRPSTAKMLDEAIDSLNALTASVRARDPRDPVPASLTAAGPPIVEAGGTLWQSFTMRPRPADQVAAQWESGA